MYAKRLNNNYFAMKGYEVMNTVFIAGHARLPAGMAAQNIYETLTITAEIDKKYGVIVTASCTLATEHGQRFYTPFTTRT